MPLRLPRSARRVLAPFVALACVSAVGGCGLLVQRAASAAVTPVIEAITAAPSRAHVTAPTSRVIIDGGLAWQRDLLLEDDTPFDPRRYTHGDVVRARWRIPVTIGGDVRAIAALGDRSCAATARQPSRWELSGGPAVNDGAEAWLVSRVSLGERQTVADRRQVGYAVGVTLAQWLGIPPSREILWLFIVPQPGSYHLSAIWEAREPDVVIAATPCIAGWMDVPLDLALAATMGREGTVGEVRRAPSRVAGGAAGVGDFRSEATRQARTDAGISLEDVAADRAPHGALEEQEGQLADHLGLTGRPEFDLVRLHQVAVDYELLTMSPSPSPSPSSSGPLSTETGLLVLRRLRSARLAALTTVPAAAAVRFCMSAQRQGLTGRGLRAWAGESTVPAGRQSPCGG